MEEHWDSTPHSLVTSLESPMRLSSAQQKALTWTLQAGLKRPSIWQAVCAAQGGVGQLHGEGAVDSTYTYTWKDREC